MGMCFGLLQSYQEFHGDLYPNTFAGVPSMTASQWAAGENKPVSGKYIYYRKTSNIRHTQSRNLNVSCLAVAFAQS